MSDSRHRVILFKWNSNVWSEETKYQAKGKNAAPPSACVTASGHIWRSSEQTSHGTQKNKQFQTHASSMMKRSRRSPFCHRLFAQSFITTSAATGWRCCTGPFVHRRHAPAGQCVHKRRSSRSSSNYRRRDLYGPSKASER